MTQPFTYGSVCSGIEAATVAWHPLSWSPVFFSEIEAFQRAALQHHYPGVPLHGDFTTIGADDYGTIDLLVGGTPCQSFSIAGLRKGMEDDRGSLALEYLKLAQRKRPSWLVWENVPGVLSSNGGRDFGAFLAGLGELGYGFAYRVLDAQYFGVAQRRRRVFVVGYLGDWRPAAAVLFECHSLQGHPAPRREKRETAPTIPARSTAGGGLGTDFDCDGELVAKTLLGKANDSRAHDIDNYVVARMRGFGDYTIDNKTSAILSRDHKDHKDLVVSVHGTQDPDIAIERAHTLGRNNGRENAVAIAIQTGQTGQNGKHHSEEISPTLDRATPHAVAYDLRGREHGSQMEGPHDTANIRASSGGSSRSYIQNNMQVRRLTPRECERLQGFPDDYTQIGWKGKPASECPDGHRYKALGNSMAVPVMNWIGRRIDSVASTLQKVA